MIQYSIKTVGSYESSDSFRPFTLSLSPSPPLLESILCVPQRCKGIIHLRVNQELSLRYSIRNNHRSKNSTSLPLRLSDSLNGFQFVDHTLCVLDINLNKTKVSSTRIGDGTSIELCDQKFISCFVILLRSKFPNFFTCHLLFRVDFRNPHDRPPTNLLWNALELY